VSVEPMGRRERKKQALRDKIVEETIALIERDGVAGVTIDGICDIVDIAKKTFYNYYGSKHDLLIDICQTHLLNRAEELVNEAQAAHKLLAKQIDYVFASLSQRNREAGSVEKELMGYLTSTMSHSLDESSAPIHFMNECYLKLYKGGKGELKPGLTPEFCAEMTVGMINAVMLNWLYYERYDVQKKIKELWTYIKASMLK